MSTEYQVLWDGTDQRPLGKFLTTTPPAKTTWQPEVVIRFQRGAATASLRALRSHFGSDWFTAHDVHVLTGLSMEHAHNAITNLIRRGLIEKESQTFLRQQRYRWTRRAA